jgi:TolB-like protein
MQKTNFIAACAFALLTAVLASGCAIAPTSVNTISQGNATAAQEMAYQLRSVLNDREPVVVTTLANLDHLRESSTIGRLISGQVATNLARDGVLVIEPKVRDALSKLPGQGELTLSHEVHLLAQQHRARVVIVGTYTEGLNKYFVNLKAVDITSNTVVAAYAYEVSTTEFPRLRY